MIIYQKEIFHDKPKRNMWIMHLFEIGVELTLGVKLTISPKTPFSCEIGLGLIRFSYSLTKCSNAKE